MKVSIKGWECEIPRAAYAAPVKPVRLKTPEGAEFSIDVPVEFLEKIVGGYRASFSMQKYESSWEHRAHMLHERLNKYEGFRWNIVDLSHDNLVRGQLLGSRVRGPVRKATIEWCGWKGTVQEDGLWVSWLVHDNRDPIKCWSGTEASLDFGLIAASESLLGGLDFQANATTEGLQK